MSFTKWLFAGLGWAFGGPIGAILGFILGNSFSSPSHSDTQPLGNSFSSPSHSDTQPPGNSFSSPSHSDTQPLGNSSHHGPYRNTGSQSDINVALMVLIAAVMKADGQVKRSELDYVKAFLLQNYGEQRGKQLLKVLQRLVQQDIPLDQVCHQIKVNTDYNTRYHMVDFLFALGGADGSFHPSELNILRLIAHYLGISHSDFTSISERHNSSFNTPHSTFGKDPYKILGVTSTATDDDVKKAYRKMALKYHPDRVAGMSEELQRNAAEQMKEINAAYEQINKLKGKK